MVSLSIGMSFLLVLESCPLWEGQPFTNLTMTNLSRGCFIVERCIALFIEGQIHWFLVN